MQSDCDSQMSSDAIMYIYRIGSTEELCVETADGGGHAKRPH